MRTAAQPDDDARHAVVLDDVTASAHPATLHPLTRRHERRLRDVYRSAGWPHLDMLELELLGAGLLERLREADGRETVRVTNAGIAQLAHAHLRNKAALSAHAALVQRVVNELARHGRLAWTGLSLRVRVGGDRADGAEAAEHAEHAEGADAAEGRGGAEGAAGLDRTHRIDRTSAATSRWCICCPDVFSVRNTSVEAYLQPVVHEIKVSRADLLGDLRQPAKRAAYLGIGGECWYVVGSDARGRPIAEPSEIPPECGVMVCDGAHLLIARSAPRRALPRLPFHLWMALAKAGPAALGAEDTQGLL